MTPPRGDTDYWRQVEAVFSAVVDLDDDLRPAHLDQLCAGCPDVRVEVESLLGAHLRADGFMPHLTRSHTSDHDEQPHDGECVGPFRLLERIGAGGMGTVYRAERADSDFSHQVAIKLMAASISHPDAARRFRAERQILASLHHPCIVTLLDGGITAQGQAYLAMEYVEGLPISTYCRQHAVSLRDRVELFRRVCGAVQYSHQHFVVHRDLKPANILITREGAPKVLDFGIAKLLEGPLSQTGATTTRIDAAAMTPNYASPEQLRGLPATTASDVYALGVLLYELMTGTRPYETSGKPLDEVLRLVVDTDVLRPSAALPSNDGPLPYSGHQLRGDLDAITLRALAKRPEERYESPAALADDLGRYLAGRPVEAREPSLGYVIRKLGARHRAVFVSTTISVAVIIALLIASLWQGQVARTQRDRAVAETAKAREMATFLSGVFRAANPVQVSGQTVTARDLLDRGTAAMQAELTADPDVKASLLLVMAEAYERLSAATRALELAKQSLALREATGPSSSIEIAESLHAIGRIHRRLGRPADAIPFLERALQLRESVAGTEDRSVAQTLRELALAHEANGMTVGTREMLDRAIRIEEQAAPRSAHLALLHNNLGGMLYERGDLLTARVEYERSIAVYQTSHEPESWGLAMPLLNMGLLLRQQEYLADAEPFFEKALVIDQDVFGRESPGTAFTLACLGDLARARGDLPRARQLLEQALEMYRKTAAADYPDVATAATYLGETLLDDGKPGQALPLLERALRISEGHHGREHAANAEILVDLARVSVQLEGPAQSEAILRRALAMQRRTLAADHASLVPTLTALADVLERQGKTGDARAYLKEAVDIAHARLSESHSHRRQAEAALDTLR